MATVLYMSVSLDGYISKPDDFLGGDDGNRLHEWYAPGGDSSALTGEAKDLAGELDEIGAVVTGYVEMLLDSWDSLREDERRNFMLKTKAAADSVQALLENMLTVSALDDIGLVTVPMPADVSEVVGEVLESLGLTSSITFRTSGDATALADRGHFAQIVTNLVTNALKYGSEPIAITVRTTTDSVVAEVADSGPGVPPEFEPHLFDRFTRSETSRTGPQRGSGLGLHIVRRLLLLNGGDIRYTPKPDGGATFAFHLPRAAQGAPTPARASSDQ